MNFVRQYKEISIYRKKLDIITNNIHYPIATILCVIISSTSITPNMITLIAIISELFGIWLIYTDLVEYSVIIVILLQFGWICDLMDGMLARYKQLGYYHPNKPSLKGSYWDSVSDHILRLLVLTFLGFHLVQQNEYGVYFALIGISIHAITQIEHILRDYILKGIKTSIPLDNNEMVNQIILLSNNIYIFYFIFILINRIDLLFIVFPIIQITLLVKRFIQFSFSKY